jgi:hypothetical protein
LKFTLEYAARMTTSPGDSASSVVSISAPRMTSFWLVI